MSNEFGARISLSGVDHQQTVLFDSNCLSFECLHAHLTKTAREMGQARRTEKILVSVQQQSAAKFLGRLPR